MNKYKVAVTMAVVVEVDVEAADTKAARRIGEKIANAVQFEIYSSAHDRQIRFGEDVNIIDTEVERVKE